MNVILLAVDKTIDGRPEFDAFLAMHGLQPRRLTAGLSFESYRQSQQRAYFAIDMKLTTRNARIFSNPHAFYGYGLTFRHGVRFRSTGKILVRGTIGTRRLLQAGVRSLHQPRWRTASNSVSLAAATQTAASR